MNVERKIIIPALIVELIMLVAIIIIGYYNLNSLTSKIKELEEGITKISLAINRVELKVDSSTDSSKVVINENAKLRTTINALTKRIDTQEEMFKMLLAQLKNSNSDINTEKIIKKLDKEKKKMEKKIKKASRDDDDDDCTSII